MFFPNSRANQPANYLLPVGARREIKSLVEGERLALPVRNAIHTWMSAYLVVRPDPYISVSATDGRFEIENLPCREHTFQLWHESLGYLKQVSIDGKPVTNKRGLHKITIKPGKNQLGKIVVSEKDYAELIAKIK
jgi:hypothetical protein